MLQFITSDMTFPHSICHIVHLKRIIIVKKVTLLIQEGALFTEHLGRACNKRNDLKTHPESASSRGTRKKCCKYR